MAKRLSLAEKYARAKQNDGGKATLPTLRSYDSITSSPRLNIGTRVSPSPTAERFKSAIPELKPHSPKIQFNRGVNDDWFSKISSTPFPKKTILLSPNRTKQPSRRYNTTTYHLSPSRHLERSRVSKDRGWLDRRQNSLGKKPQDGMLLRFKSFLNKFSLDDQQRYDPEFEALKQSAQIVIPSYGIDQNNIELDDLLRRKRKLSGDFDEVDSIVQRTKSRLDEQQRTRGEEEFLELLKKEKLERQHLQETHQRQIQLLKRAHEDETHQLTREIEELRYQSTLKQREFERRKMQELEDLVKKNNETFLLQHKENETRLKMLTTEMERKEKELNMRERKLKKTELENKLQTPRRASIAFSEGSFDTSSPKINRKDLYTHKIQLTEEEEIERAADTYEFQVINFYDMMQKLSEGILQKQTVTPEEQTLLLHIERIVTSLDEHINVRPKDQDVHETKLAEYSRFFDEFDAAYSLSPTQAREKYSISVLSAIWDSFDSLTQSLNARLVKKAQHLRDLEKNFSEISITEDDYNQTRINRAVRILKGKATMIVLLKRTIALLHRLRNLKNRITGIRGKLGPEI